MSIGSAFDIFNKARCKSPVLEDIWRRAYGNDYPLDAKPDAFYPQSVVSQIITAAQRIPDIGGQRLLDIGCGHGLLGMHLVDRLNVRFHGIDISPESIRLAREAASRRMPDYATFSVADASSTGLEDDSCALVTCLDVLLYLTDKLAVCKEVHRVLKSGGLFAFTTWEQSGYNSRLGAQQVDDYRPLVVEAGFEVVQYGLVESAREQQALVFDGLVDQEEALKQDVGEEAAAMFIRMARSAKEESGVRKYIFGLARRI